MSNQPTYPTHRIELMTRTGTVIGWNFKDQNEAMVCWDRAVDNTLPGETCKLYKMPDRILMSEYTPAQRGAED